MWDVEDYGDSKNHHMYSDFMSWIIKTIVGVSLDETEPGQGVFKINPYYFEDLSYAKCTYNSNYGKIDLAWNKTENGIELSINLDDGVEAYYKGEMLKAGENKFIQIN